MNVMPNCWNRVVSVGTDSDGRRYVRNEPDIRHAELVLRNLGLEGSKAKPLTTPGFKVDEKELALREKEVPLDSQGATRYRSCVMRLSYLALDRADLGEPVNFLTSSMARPTPGSSKGSQEGCTLLVRDQTLGSSFVATKRFRSAIQLTLTAISLDAVRHAGALRE